MKRQAKEHDGFRHFAVAQAQRLHRIDMRMRLGILHDSAAQERMHEREQRAAEEKKKKAEIPIVRTEAEQKKYEEEQERLEREGPKKEESTKVQRVKIRPLSETRAIELGANFFSEAFIFGVAAGLLIWDAWRSRKKESARRDDVAERLEKLEAEVEMLRNEVDPDLETLKDLGRRIHAAKQGKASSWWNPLSRRGSVEDAAIIEETKDLGETAPIDKPTTPVKKQAEPTPIMKQAEPKEVAVVTNPPTPDSTKIKPPDNVTKPSASQAEPAQTDSPKKEKQ
jgi:outer membrane biosynthesis protein TonB